MFRSILSVFLGFVLMVILAMTAMGILFTLFPYTPPGPDEIELAEEVLPPVMAILLLMPIELIIAAFGGYFTAAVAGHKEREHAVALATVVFVMGLVSLVSAFGQEPIWYSLTRLVGTPIFVLLGGALRHRQYGRTSAIQVSEESA